MLRSQELGKDSGYVRTQMIIVDQCLTTGRSCVLYKLDCLILPLFKQCRLEVALMIGDYKASRLILYRLCIMLLSPCRQVVNLIKCITLQSDNWSVPSDCILVLLWTYGTYLLVVLLHLSCTFVIPRHKLKSFSFSYSMSGNLRWLQPV